MGLGDGIVLRLVIYVVLTAIAIGYVVRYATRVKADHARTLVGFSREDEDLLTQEGADVPELTSRRRGVLWLTARSEEHTSELQSLKHLVCRLLLEKKKTHT